ncbi:fluoride efflux transporter CrcB [Halorutilales archaeon Cl-col2-1]
MSSIQPALLVGVGGAIGAVTRYSVSRVVSMREFPLSTLVVNTVGSFVLALVTFSDAGSQLTLLVGTGACGSFTTFSSFSFETFRLWETGEKPRSALNAAANLFLSLTAVWLGSLVA